MSSGHFIDGWSFNTSFPTQLSLQQSQKLDKACWYHLQRDDPGTALWLKQVGVPDVAIESVLANDTRPRFEALDDDNFLLILRGVNLNEGEVPDDMLSIRLLYFNGALISTRKYPSKAISEIRELLAQNKGPKDLATVITSIIQKLHHRIAEFLEPVEEKVEQFEQGGASNSINDQLALLNKRLLKLRRFLKPQSFALDDFIDAEMPLLANARLKLSNCRDSATRINESIEFYIEQIGVISQTLNHNQAEKVNRNTYVLSIISAIFLPISFLTGLLGVNIGGMPGVESTGAFTLFSVVLLVFVAVEIWLMRKLRFI